MIFIIGSLFSGKRDFAEKQLGYDRKDIIDNAQDMIKAQMTDEEIIILADELAEEKIVISTETGCGIVPVDKEERILREHIGRLNCLLAEKAETVVRVFCGIPVVLKGSLT